MKKKAEKSNVDTFAIDHSADKRPIVLNIPFGEENPYQRLIYSPAASDYAIAGGPKTFTGVTDRAAAGAFAAVHIHWDDLIFNLGRGQSSTQRNSHNSQILASIERIKAAGVPILFTIHNARPHAPGIDLQTFFDMRQRILTLSDIVHVHSNFAARIIRENFSIDPTKIRGIPHPSYLGAYEEVEKTLTRKVKFHDKRRFLFFGAFRKNKGLDHILKALDILGSENLDFHVAFHGRLREKSREALEADMARFGQNVTLNLNRVPDSDVPGIFSAADVFLAPFSDQVLTSGSVMLAQTFGLPIIAPNTGSMRESTPQSNHKFLFDPEDQNAFRRSMEVFCTLDRKKMLHLRAEAFEFSRTNAPDNISTALSKEIGSLIASRRNNVSKTIVSANLPASSLAAADRLGGTQLDTGLHYLSEILSLKDDETIRILDVGANPMGREPVYQKLLENELCFVTGFDPQEETLLEISKTNSRRETYLPHALGDGKTHELNIYRGSGLTSLLKIRSETLNFLRGLKRAARLLDRQTMETRRLDDLSEITRVDFLKIDIQGAELMVMENAIKTLSSTLAIQAEVSFFPLYESQPTFGDIDVFLRNQGFVPFDFAHIERRIILQPWSDLPQAPVARQMLDGDIIYLRDLSQPDALTDQDIKRIALLAAGVFEQVDLTLKCLDLLTKRGQLRASHVETYISYL